MSNVFVIAEMAPSWQKPVLLGLLAISLVLWAVWLIKVLISRRLLRGFAQIQDRPQLPQVALAAISLVLLASLWAWLLRGIVGSQNLELALAGALAELFTCLLILGLLAWQEPNRLSCFGLALRGLTRHLGWGLITALAVWPMATYLLLPVSLWTVKFLSRWLWNLTYTPQPHTLFREMTKTTVAIDFWLAVGLAVIIAPLTEEIFFRGLLQGALARLFRSRWTAIAVSAAIFSIFHLTVRPTVPAGEVSLANVEAVPSLFLLGLALGYSYEKAGSLYRPMVIHLTFNALSLIMVWPQLP